MSCSNQWNSAIPWRFWKCPRSIWTSLGMSVRCYSSGDSPRNRLGWVSTPRSDEQKKRTEAFCFHVSCPFAISPLFLLCHSVRKNTEGPHTCDSLTVYTIINFKLQNWPFRDFPMRFSQNFFDGNGHLFLQAERFPSFTRTRFALHFIQTPVLVHSAHSFLHSANETKQSWN